MVDADVRLGLVDVVEDVLLAILQIGAFSGQHEQTHLVAVEAQVVVVEVNGGDLVGVLEVLVEEEVGDAVEDKLVLQVDFLIAVIIVKEVLLRVGVYGDCYFSGFALAQTELQHWLAYDRLRFKIMPFLL